MTFWIKKNKNASAKWKTIHNVLYVIWFGCLILRGIVKMRDRANNVESDLHFIILVLWVVVTMVILVLNFTHWLKPKWFENKN